MPFEAKATETKANLVVQIRRGLNMSHEGVLKKMNVQLKDLFIRLLEPDKGSSSLSYTISMWPWSLVLVLQTDDNTFKILISGKRITLHEMFSHSWLTEDGKKPLLKKPPLVFSHEVRQKVIEQVAHLHGQSVSNVMQEIRMNQQQVQYCVCLFK